MAGWQPRQRRTLGMLNGLLSRLQAVANAHPAWADYDLLTHLLAALHLIIESDRLTGGHTEDQIVDELVALVASEHPGDAPAVHRAIAEAVVDVLTNARNRRLRLRDRYLHAASGAVEVREQSFAFVRAVGDEESSEPTLRATPEAVNVFQNLYQFDPSDRAAAERYRSDRMLRREEYDEVLTSIDRRATSVHGLRGELEGLVRRIGYNVRDVDYAGEVIPRLDEVLDTVAEQIDAEERFAEAVADIAHHAAPDLPRLQRIAGNLRGLVGALGILQSTALETRRTFEAEQDRQLFTYRRITINPQAQLLEPLLHATPGAAVDVLTGPLAVWLGPRARRVMHLGELVARCTPGERSTRSAAGADPFDLGERRGEEVDVAPALLRSVAQLLAGLDRPTRLSALLDAAADAPGDDPQRNGLLPWALAVTIASAYGVTATTSEPPGAAAGFDHDRLTVVATGDQLPDGGVVTGDDLVVVPRRAPETR
ncbi:hypothetical protein [Sorangium sp. So ce388]|uniref:hypothetical protein n=1 Tax=Sorangium sp. So ce388 TaxID=3133309 RepID=UPI003F5B3832